MTESEVKDYLGRLNRMLTGDAFSTAYESVYLKRELVDFATTVYALLNESAQNQRKAS